MNQPKSRLPTWVVVILVAAGLLVVSVLGVVQYLRSVPALHPDAARVSSVMDAPPAPAWTAAVDAARTIARQGIANQNLPGLSVAVGVGGEVVWAEGFGWADIERRVPVSPRVRFRIGHASKALTSAGVGVLRDAGRLHLEDEIQATLPDFPKKAWPVTLRQVMGHMAGFKHYSGEEADVPTGHCARAAEGLRSFAQEPLLFEPGTRYRYSTYGWVLVSATVEAVAGEPFFAFMRSRVFEPLGMVDTGPDESVDPATASGGAPDAPSATPYATRATFYFPSFSGDNTFGHGVARSVDYSCFAGAGAFLSTPTDLVRFGLAMQRGTLLQPATVRMLQTRQSLTSGADTDYGLGWMLEAVTLAGTRTPMVFHASRSLLGASTSYLTFPDLGLVVAVTSNTTYGDARSIALGVAEVFAQAARIAR